MRARHLEANRRDDRKGKEDRMAAVIWALAIGAFLYWGLGEVINGLAERKIKKIAEREQEFERQVAEASGKAKDKNI